MRKVNGSKKYHRVNRSQQWRIGFAMQSGKFQFSQDVLRGLEEAAENHGVQLIVLDNNTVKKRRSQMRKLFVDRR